MNKNLNNTIKDMKGVPAPYEAEGFRSGSYTKTHKLVIALYMVTDIIDKEEPIRNKLRTLGTEIISDINNQILARTVLASRIDEVMSFLDIALTMNMISEMNKNILINEFTQLKNSLIIPQDNPVWLEEFLKNSPLEEYPLGGGGNKSTPAFSHPSRGELNSKGHTRIGVQKGSTLLKALSDKTKLMSNRNNTAPSKAGEFRSGFDILKKERRYNIINIIKNNGGSSTIKDIKVKVNMETQGSLAYSEKTLQRELISMVKDGVLNKTGEKRWSRYFVKN